MFEQRPLSTLIERQIGGGTPPRSNPAFWSGPIPWASVKDFEDASLTLSSTAERITQSGLDASTAKLIPAGTPLVCTRMAVGRCAITTQPVAINQDVRALTPKAEVQPRYLLRLLDFLRPAAESQAVGSTVKGIRTSDYLAIKVPVAPVIEQPAIARILDTLDTQIEKTQALIAKLEQVKEGLLHDLLTRGVDENGKLRPSAEEAPELYKESALGLIPRDWDCISLREAALPGRESFIDGDWIEAPYITQQGIRLIQTGNVGVGKFIEKADSRKFVSGSTFKLLRCKPVLPGDLLLCRLADPIGRGCEVPNGLGEAITSVDCTIVRVDPTVFVKRLLLAWLNSKRHLQHAQDSAAGSTRSRISRSNMAKLPVPKPPLSEQTVMATLLDKLERDLSSEVFAAEKLYTQKSGLMDDLLTGRVRVTPLLDRKPA